MTKYIAGLLLLLSAGLAAAQPDWSDQLDARITRAMAKERVTGASVVIADRDGIVFSRGYGYADRKQRRAVSAETRFPFANMSKLVTAIAALQLVAQGELGLDQPLDQVLPGLEIDSRFADGAAPTLRQLLSHHSGLPSNVLAGIYVEQPPDRLSPLPDLYQAQPPGTIYGYSNQAYALVGHLIEQLSGRPYVQQVREQVLDPLGMHQSGFAIHPADALGHDKRGRVQPAIYPRDLPAMGLRGTANDLGQLIHWVLGASSEPVLAAALRDEMSVVQNSTVALDLDNRTGLAWQLTNTDGFAVPRALRFTSTSLQFRGTLIVIPDHGVGLAVLANSPDSMDFVLDQARRAMDDLLAQRAGIPRPDRDDTTFPALVPMPAAASSADMALRYVTPLGLMAFAGDRQRFDVSYLGKSFRAYRREDGWYSLSYRLLGLIDIRFDLIKKLLLRPARIGNQAVLLVYYQGRRFLFGSALDARPGNGHLEQLAGTYRLTNPDFFSDRLKLKTIELRFDEGLLYGVYKLPLFISLKPRIPLLAHGANEYYVPGLGTAQGERMRYDPQQQAFEFAGYRFARDR